MSLETPSISFIGAGNMGEAMLRGLAKAGLPPARLRAFDLRQERLQALAVETGFNAHFDLASAVNSADVVVLATKPQSFGELLDQLAPLLKPHQMVISIAAGVRLARLEAAFDLGQPLIRVMPNTPGLIGQGVSAYCLGGAAGEQHAAVAELILKPLGQVLRVSEGDMDAVTALSGSGPAYVFLFMEALQAAGVQLGLSEQASFDLAAQTLVGASAMVQARQKSPADLRVAVTSPGGTTAAALKVFEDAGFRDLVAKALTAARDRSVELGRGMKIDVHVQPRASRNAVLGWKEGALKVALTAPPVEGAANAALVELLAKAFGLKRRQISVVGGLQSRHKTVEISGVDQAFETELHTLGT